jgi:hypothetical protein
VTPPATGSQTYEYGLNDAYYQAQFGDGWMWPPGPNGQFVVNAGQTAAVNAPGLVLPAFGTIDMKLDLDSAALAPPFDATPVTTVQVKSSAWGWSNIALADGGAGVYSVVLSDKCGAGKQYKHTGFLKSGQTVEFVYVLDGVEYKDANGAALPDGVAAATMIPGGAWEPAAVGTTASNTFILAPTLP